LAGVNAFSGDEEVFVLLVSVGVSEDNLGKRSTAARIVNNFLDDSLDVPLALSEVKSSELSGRDSL